MTPHSSSLEKQITPRHLLDALLRHAVDRPDAIAISDRRATKWTWQQLASAVAYHADQLGSVPSLAHEVRNEIADVVMAMACLANGTMEIAIDARLPDTARAKMLDISAIKLTVKEFELISGKTQTPDWCNRLRKCADRVDVHQPSLVLWTSGTTASPRGVMLSARSLLLNASAKLKAVPEDRQSHRLTVLPISHAYARTCDMGTWLLSGCHWTIDQGVSALDRIDTERLPTHINCVPLIANEIEARLDRDDARFTGLKIIGCGGAAMPAEQFNRFRERGIEIIQGYGCTETSPVICSASPGQSQPGCVGRLVDGWEAAVRGDRLFVRGECTMVGYLNDPIATALKIDDDDWLDTGDLVEKNADATYRILGRADDVIVLPNGFKIHPQGVESKLTQMSDIEHAVVMYVDGHLLVAIQGATGDRIKAIIRNWVPPGTSFEVVALTPPLSRGRDELTAKGTPRRQAVRERFQTR